MSSFTSSKWFIVSTVVLAVLVTLASLLGLLSTGPYANETENWQLQARGQDIGNLLAVLVLLVSGVKAVQGSYRASLVWLGTLFYLMYAYIIYAMTVHFNSLFLVYVAVIGVSFYSVVGVFAKGISGPKLPRPNKFAAITLIVIGALFALMWLGEIIPALAAGEIPQSITDAGLWVNPVYVLDLAVVLPGMVACGVLALKGERYGTYLIAPWLAFAVLMGSSIVATMALMMANGYENTVPPLVALTLVVLVSLVALVRFLKTLRHA